MLVLVVEDHRPTRDLIERSLGRDGHQVTACATFIDAEAAALTGSFDVLVVDIMLPDGSGMDLCRDLRAENINTPILLLTARGQIRDRVAGLDAGADDYLPKPFAVAELLARVRALGRRQPELPQAKYRAGSVVVEPASRKVRVDGAAVALTSKEFAILELLASRQGRVVDRRELLERIWGDVSDSADKSLGVLMSRIRRKLGGDASPITTSHGVGYAFGSGE